MTTVGISAYNIGAADLVDLAEAADELGFHGIWLGEHLFRAADYTSTHPRVGDDAGHQMDKPIVDVGTELIDQWVTFGAAGRVTERLHLATGIYLLPLRHPLVTARSAATAHDFAPGRVILGAGAGWLVEEFDALGVPFKTRMSRFEECVAILRKAWAAEEFSWSGKHFEFDTLQVCNEPIHVPVILGGNAEKALERAARLGDGWFSSGTPALADSLKLHQEILRLRELHADASAPFDCYFRIDQADAATVRRYASEGIDNVVVWADQIWVGETLEQRRAALAAAAVELGVQH